MELIPIWATTLILVLDVVLYFFATLASQALFSSESSKLKLLFDKKGAKKAYDVCEKSEKYNFSLKILKLVLEAIALFAIYALLLRVENLKAITWITILIFVVANVFVLNSFGCAIAEKSPEKILIKFTSFIVVVDILLMPIAFLPKKLKDLIVGKKEDKITEEELLSIVEEAEEDGTLDSEETELISSMIEFNDVDVSEILIPRINLVAIEEKDSLEEIKRVFLEEGYSRLPVYKGSIDTIVGIINEKDFFRLLETQEKNISSIIYQPIVCSEHLKIQELLRIMQAKKEHMAIVVDEYGGVMGIVTMEDILEEIVGEIFDEHDVAPTSSIVKQKDGSFLVGGDCDANEFLEFFNIESKDQDEYQTINGYLVAKIGYIPLEKEEFNFEGLKYLITKADEKMILEFKVEKGENE